jgi:uncharacterized membrane protein
VPPIATLVIGTEFTGLASLLAGRGVPPTPGLSRTLVLTLVLLVLTFVSRTRRVLAESPRQR